MRVSRRTLVLLGILVVCSLALTARYLVWGESRDANAGVDPALVQAAAADPVPSGKDRPVPADPPRQGRARPGAMHGGK